MSPMPERSSASVLREVLAVHGRLSTPVDDLPDDGDLYAAGLTSLNTVNLLLAIEDRFDVEFPDDLLSRRTFQSIDTLADAVESLVVAPRG